jgi:hypothetical protein
MQQLLAANAHERYPEHPCRHLEQSTHRKLVFARRPLLSSTSTPSRKHGRYPSDCPAIRGASRCAPKWPALKGARGADVLLQSIRLGPLSASRALRACSPSSVRQSDRYDQRPQSMLSWEQKQIQGATNIVEHLSVGAPFQA